MDVEHMTLIRLLVNSLDVVVSTDTSAPTGSSCLIPDGSRSAIVFAAISA